MKKVLNLYAGIGGNRKLWEDVEVTAVEYDQKIAQIYQTLYPDDEVIIGDAKEVLVKRYEEFEFIWGSPPCPTHSKLCLLQKSKKLPEMDLYSIIIFLQHWFKNKWVIENVVGYYDPLVKPTQTLGRHYFWSNFHLPIKEFDHMKGIQRDYYEGDKKQYGKRRYQDMNVEELCKIHGFDRTIFNGHSKTFTEKILRNCVFPPEGKFIFDCAFKHTQEVLF